MSMVAPHTVPAAPAESLQIGSVVIGGPAPAGGRRSAVVELHGRLDAVEAPALRAEFAGLLEARVVTMVVDLDGVDFIDSAGLAALVRLRRDLHAAGGDVVLISPAQPHALRVFRLTQFDEVFRLVDVRAEE